MANATEAPARNTMHVVERTRCTTHLTMDPRDARGVYRTAREVELALRDGTYDVRKTMFLDRNGRVYYLCWGRA